MDLKKEEREIKMIAFVVIPMVILVCIAIVMRYANAIDGLMK